jgi:hypothetical protein
MWAQLTAKLRIRWPTTPRGYNAAIMKDWEAIDKSTITEFV